MGLFDIFRRKSDKGQANKASEESSDRKSNPRPNTVVNAYTYDATVNRCVNMLIDSSAEIELDVKDPYKFTPIAMLPNGRRIKKADLTELLNTRPNPYQDANTFWRNMWTDFYVFGQMMIYFDGTALYRIPAGNTRVYAAEKTGVVSHFEYNGVTYQANEVIYVRDNCVTTSGGSEISANSRITAALNSIIRKDKVLMFREKFVDKGCIPGVVLESDDLLGRAFKERMREEISVEYNPQTGKYLNGVLILDGGLKLRSINTGENIKNLDFQKDMQGYDHDICVALGVPPILLEGGNNANISPNVKLFYSQSIIPNVRKLESCLELFFGYDIKQLTNDVAALLADKVAERSSIVGLKNNGIISGNEARSELRFEKSTDPVMEEIIQPANVAGSATGLDGEQGGRPSGDSNAN